MFEESGLPESGCDDKLEKRCYSEDFYALKWGKYSILRAGSSIEEQGLELRIRIDLP